MEPQPVKTAIVAFGKSAKIFHAPFLQTNPKFEVVATVERNRNEGETWFPGIVTYRSMEEMLDNKAIELVVITTPNDTHFSYSKMALQNEKYAVVEKPFTITPGEAMELVELSKTSQKFASVYHNRRYVSDFRSIVEIVREDLLGDIHEYECHFDRYRPALVEGAWREKNLPGSGITYDLGSHLIDQTLCLFGFPASVTATIKTQRPGLETDDYFDIRFDYANGMRSILKSGMLVREMGYRYQIHGTKGSFLKSGDDPQEEKLKAGALPDTPAWGFEPEGMEGLIHTEIHGEAVRQKRKSYAGNYGDYYRNIYQSIRHHAPLKEKPEHGYNVVKLIELAFESSRLQKTIPVAGLMETDYPFENLPWNR